MSKNNKLLIRLLVLVVGLLGLFASQPALATVSEAAIRNGSAAGTPIVTSWADSSSASITNRPYLSWSNSPRIDTYLNPNEFFTVPYHGGKYPHTCNSNSDFQCTAYSSDGYNKGFLQPATGGDRRAALGGFMCAASAGELGSNICNNVSKYVTSLMPGEQVTNFLMLPTVAGDIGDGTPMKIYTGLIKDLGYTNNLAKDTYYYSYGYSTVSHPFNVSQSIIDGINTGSQIWLRGTADDFGNLRVCKGGSCTSNLQMSNGAFTSPPVQSMNVTNFFKSNGAGNYEIQGGWGDKINAIRPSISQAKLSSSGFWIFYQVASFKVSSGGGGTTPDPDPDPIVVNISVCSKSAHRVISIDEKTYNSSLHDRAGASSPYCTQTTVCREGWDANAQRLWNTRTIWVSDRTSRDLVSSHAYCDPKQDRCVRESGGGSSSYIIGRISLIEPYYFLNYPSSYLSSASDLCKWSIGPNTKARLELTPGATAYRTTDLNYRYTGPLSGGQYVQTNPTTNPVIVPLGSRIGFSHVGSITSLFESYRTMPYGYSSKRITVTSNPTTNAVVANSYSGPAPVSGYVYYQDFLNSGYLRSFLSTEDQLGRYVCRYGTINPYGGTSGRSDYPGVFSGNTACAYVPFDYLIKDPTVGNSIPSNQQPGGPITVDQARIERGNDGSFKINSPTGTKTKPSQWQLNLFSVRKIEIADIQARISGTKTAAGQSPCASIDAKTADKQSDWGNCQTPKQGSFTINTSPADATINLDYTFTVPADTPVGTKFCFVVSITPWFDEEKLGANIGTAGTWKHGIPTCVTVDKRPKLQVRGGGVISTGPVATNHSQINSEVFGSWTEYDLAANGKVSNFASNAGYLNRRPNTPTINYLDSLTFSNTSLGNFGAGDKISHLAGTSTSYLNVTNYFSSLKPDTALTSDLDLSQGFINSVTAGNFHIVKTTREVNINNPITIANDKRLVVIADKAININRNVSYSSDSVSSIKSLPQLILISKEAIKIHPDVAQVDAWLVANNPDVGGVSATINTCFMNDQLSAKVCDKQLVINGPIIADILKLRRTAFSDVTKTWDDTPLVNNNNATTTGSIVHNSNLPAEIVNFRPDAYLFGYSAASERNIYKTTNVKELPARY